MTDSLALAFRSATITVVRAKREHGPDLGGRVAFTIPIIYGFGEPVGTLTVDIPRVEGVIDEDTLIERLAHALDDDKRRHGGPAPIVPLSGDEPAPVPWWMR